MGSAKIEEARQHRRVGLTYARSEDNSYVALTGTAEVVVDAKKAEELWDPSYRAWFPEGPNDPDLALIKVSVEMAEYWSAPALTWPVPAGFVVIAPSTTTIRSSMRGSCSGARNEAPPDRASAGEPHSRASYLRSRYARSAASRTRIRLSSRTNSPAFSRRLSARETRGRVAPTMAASSS